MKLFANSDINRLYIHSTFYGLAENLGGVFVFAFLLKSGFGIPVTLCTMAALTMTRFVSRSTMVPIIKRIGLRNGLVFGTLMDAVSYLILMKVSAVDWLYVFFIIFGAFGNAYYWTCYHAFVAKLGDDEHRGSQVSTAQAFTALTSFVAPLIGAVLILTWGAPAAFLAAAGICAVGAVPLLFTPNVTIADTAVISSQAKSFAIRSFLADGLFAASLYFIWAVAMFEALGQSYGSYGLALSIAGVAGAAMGLVAGRLFDLGHHKRAFQLAYGMAAVVVIAKAIGSTSATGAIAANIIGAMVPPIYLSVVNARLYVVAKSTPCTLRFHIYSEGAWDVAAATGCLVAAGFSAAGFGLTWPLLMGLFACVLGYRTLTRSQQ